MDTGLTAKGSCRVLCAAFLLMHSTAIAMAQGGVPPARTAEPAAPQRMFDIEEIRVEGNTLLKSALIENAVAPFLGPRRTADDVEQARLALDTLYAAQGYPTAAAEIPEQDPSDGIVVLRVTERKVGRLRIRGSRYFVLSEIRGGVPSLAEGRVPNLNDVQKEIVALNQWPDRRVTPVLRPGAAPGTVDVDLDVKDTLPLHASLELNSRRSANTTPLRASASLSYSNLWQRGDSASVSFQAAPQHPADTQVLTASYLFRIPNSNMSLLASYLNSNSNVATIGGTGVIGKGTVMGLRLQIPLGTDGPFTHSLSVGFDYKSFRDTVLLGADSTVTPVTYLPLTAQYQASWQNEASETLLSGSVVLGTRGLGSDAQAFDQKRYLALPNFSYVRADLTRRDDLPWALESFVHASGQATGQPLISNEQYSIGGIDTVRGYLEAEALGDYGGSVQAELRGPLYSDWAPGTASDARPFVFVDAGNVALRNPLPSQRRTYSLASTGAGVRVHLADQFSIDLAAGHALVAGPNTPGGTTRFLFRVNGAF